MSKKFLNLCSYHYFLPTSLQREKEGLLSPDSLSDSLLQGQFHPHFVRRLCPPKPPFPPFPSSPLSCPLHSGSSTASCESHLLGHASLPKSKARVYALYSCLMSRERGLSGGKLHKRMKSVDKANNPRRLAAGDEAQVGAKETATFGG